MDHTSSNQQIPQTPEREPIRLLFEDLRSELASPPAYQSTVGGSPNFREHISLWDKDAYLQRARDMALPLPSPPRILQVDFKKAHDYNLMEYPRDFVGMEVEDSFSPPVPLDFGDLEDEDQYATHTQLTEYVERSIRPLSEKVQSLLEFSHSCGGVVSDLVKASSTNDQSVIGKLDYMYHILEQAVSAFQANSSNCSTDL